MIRSNVVSQRIEGALDLEEEIINGHASDLHAGRRKRRFHSGHKAVELGNQILMITPAAFPAFCGRHAEARTTHLFLPLEIRRLVMDTRVPNEIEVQRVIEVIAVGVLFRPCLNLLPVDYFEDGAWIVLLTVVAGNQIGDTLGNLES